MLPPRRYACLSLLVFAALAVACAAFVAVIDPYWLWRDRAGWGLNPAIETRMRFVKSVQLLVRQPETVLLGSSVVYRGLDPAVIDRNRTYNAGIASLRIREAEAYVRQMLRFGSPKLIVLGVDYFAFDELKTSEAGFDPALADSTYPITAGFTALLSTTALADAWRLARRSQQDPDGTWHRNGYKETRPRTPAEVSEMLAMTRTLFAQSRIASQELAALERIVRMTRVAGVRLILFVPPYHRTWIEAAETSSQAFGFDAWVDAIAELARQHQVPLWDFARANPYEREAVGSGSPWYLDPSHFSPLLGQWMLARMGLPLRPGHPPPPADFGRQLS